MLVSCSCSYYNLDQYSKSPLAASTTCVTSRWPHWLSGRTSLILKEFKGGVTACRSHAVKQTSKSIKIFPQVPVFQTGSSTCIQSPFAQKKSGIFRSPTFISGLPKKCVIRALSSVGYRNADASRSLLEARQFQTHRFMESHLTDLTDCRHRWWEYMQPIFLGAWVQCPLKSSLADIHVYLAANM